MVGLRRHIAARFLHTSAIRPRVPVAADMMRNTTILRPAKALHANTELSPACAGRLRRRALRTGFHLLRAALMMLLILHEEMLQPAIGFRHGDICMPAWCKDAAKMPHTR